MPRAVPEPNDTEMLKEALGLLLRTSVVMARWPKSALYEDIIAFLNRAAMKKEQHG